jgi:ethanolamine utilization protein EutN
MQQAKVVGTAVSSTKHPSMKGWRLLIVQPLGISGQRDGDPALVVDHLGAGMGDTVLISSDGKGARQLMNDQTSPVRWFVLGIVDE